MNYPDVRIITFSTHWVDLNEVRPSRQPYKLFYKLSLQAVLQKTALTKFQNCIAKLSLNNFGIYHGRCRFKIFRARFNKRRPHE